MSQQPGPTSITSVSSNPSPLANGTPARQAATPQGAPVQTRTSPQTGEQTTAGGAAGATPGAPVETVALSPDAQELLEQERGVEAEDPNELEEELSPEELEFQRKLEALEAERAQLEAQLEDQIATGDREGAQATQARLGEVGQRLKTLLASGPEAGPVAAPGPVAGQVGGPAQAGGGPAGGGPVGGAPYAPPFSPPFGGAPAAGGPATFGPSSAPPVDPSALARTSPLGQRLAEAAQRHCNGPGGYCFRHASRALDEVGIHTSGASAYMAADQLARSDKLREVQVNPKELDKLPAGAVVVWDRGPGKPHGHISIADGKGGEYSDVYRKQITGYGTQVRVFLPADMQQNP